MQRIVYLNGCFDELHKGHSFFFWKAKQYGDLLYAGIMSDSFIRQHKQREPRLNESQRQYLVSCDPSVDRAIIMPVDEISEIELILQVNPTVLCFGPGQYTKDWNWQLKSILKSFNPGIQFEDITGYDRERNQSSVIRNNLNLRLCYRRGRFISSSSKLSPQSPQPS